MRNAVGIGQGAGILAGAALIVEDDATVCGERLDPC